MANYDILGNIAIVKFKDDAGKEEKLDKAKDILNQYKTVKTVVEKIDKVRGRLRTIKTNHILGDENLEALYLENGCRFKLNIETCYFSPRLANERMEIAKLISNEIRKNKIKKAKVLVMFSGVAPFSIIIAKQCSAEVVSIELGKECCKYALNNAIMNKVENKIQIIQGDVKKAVLKLGKSKFDFIVMPRPNLKETFLKQAFCLSKKKTKIIYYGFCPESKLQNMLDEINKEAEKYKKKIRITNVREAGDIAPYEHRYRIEIDVL